jgi:acylphosphatase
MSAVRAVQGKVRGRVQGVAYRASFQRQASALGVAGWVRNCADGTVEFMVQGEPGPVETLLAWARSGPALARVAELQVREVDLDPKLVRLEIRS